MRYRTCKKFRHNLAIGPSNRNEKSRVKENGKTTEENWKKKPFGRPGKPRDIRGSMKKGIIHKH